jgi:hypothetical protein
MERSEESISCLDLNLSFPVRVSLLNTRQGQAREGKQIRKASFHPARVLSLDNEIENPSILSQGRWNMVQPSK